MKHSEMDEKWKDKSSKDISGRWKQLNDLTREYTTIATKYCFVTNAGVQLPYLVTLVFSKVCLTSQT